MNNAVPVDLQLSSGMLRGYRLGPPGAPPVICVPGLDANARSFDLVAAALVRRGQQVVVLDLRGRGFSQATAVGTYGWRKHAEDVIEVANLLGFEAFDLVGHSMGAFVSMQAVGLAPGRVRRLVVIDSVGPADLLTVPAVVGAALRLGLVYPSARAYCAMLSAPRIVRPWEELWRDHFLYELEAVSGWVRPRTSLKAVAEDLLYGMTHNASTLWPRLQLPTLLVRADRRLTLGFVVASTLRKAFLSAVPSAEAVDVDANHYELMANVRALRAIGDFLACPEDVSWLPATANS